MTCTGKKPKMSEEEAGEGVTTPVANGNSNDDQIVPQIGKGTKTYATCTNRWLFKMETCS